MGRESVKEVPYRACKLSQLECINADWKGEERSLLRLVCANSSTAVDPQMFKDEEEEADGWLQQGLSM